MQGAGSWLFPLKDGQPPLGWHDTVAYLVLPVLLVVSQVVSQKIMTPQTDDPQQQQTQKILQFLPLLIGAPLVCRLHCIMAGSRILGSRHKQPDLLWVQDTFP